MPLPLPNLDTRRWSDLVDEGRALIPRYAPGWTDHNTHDPGIMLVELLAWLVESLMYRANRIPERDRRKFLSLIGYAPLAPQPATTTLACTLALGTGTLALPEGTMFVADDGAGGTLPFTTAADAMLVEAQLVALQLFDGTRFVDRTRALGDGLPIPLFGANPAVPAPYAAGAAPAFLLGFDRALPVGVPITLRVVLDGRIPGEREALAAEAAATSARCAPRPPHVDCTPCTQTDPWCGDRDPNGGATSGGSGAGGAGGAGGASTPVALPPHHAVRLVWEWLAADGWHTLDAVAGEVVDDTRSLTLDGDVRLRVPDAMASATIGAVGAPRFWIRCRMLAGPFDSAPMLRALLANAVAVEQSIEAHQRFAIAKGTAVAGAITVGARQSLTTAFDPASGAITALAVVTAPAPDALHARVLAYTAPTAAVDGAIVLTLERLSPATGFPEQQATLAAAPVARGTARVWSVESGTARAWTSRPDLDAARPTDAAFVLDAQSGTLAFGDGVHGRVPPPGATLLAAARSTSTVRGNVAAGRRWSIASSPINDAILGAPAAVAASLATIANPVPASGGADAESVDHAAGRAVSALWAHERLVQLAPPAPNGTLDQLPRDAVLAVEAPERATTIVDFERIARGVPGTRVRRARAWAELDTGVPCVEAAGTVTVVLVPELPLGRPTPSAGLRRAVRAWLDRRRVLCTRLRVVAPEYLVVSVRATVQALPGADAARLGTAIRDALAAFLDPIAGGPAGLGWPFGRDVFRSEVLALIDGVPGVDHVLALELSAGACAPQCGDLCVAPTWLVASGTHDIQVEGA